ncbi:MAG: bile acid:sodium symporter family protein [Proteobacteria bacterium]|jgi:BASS family bile acid:Na+ symporter|nr:bile acid:sodium symporter family protein [Pseudomonadota bacterium]MDA0929036.1 bile acid:sodium symporter family protein [Pseudomonadota bacterium]
MTRFNALFPLWAFLLAITAFFFSDAFSRLSDLIVPLLALVMFCMGLTLGKEDFQRILKSPKPVLVGVVLQFLLMPILALTLATMLQLSSQLTAGMVLVGSCAGGTASNVISYLAKGDLALSISMTITSTLVGVIATPLLCAFYLSETISVDRLGMLMSIVQMVLLPVTIGTLCNHFMPTIVERSQRYLPSLSIVIILLIIAIVVALNSDSLLAVGGITIIAVALHNLGGLAGGFYLSRLMGFDIRQSHTIAIEVGMQNSGLGVALALEFFSATAALPGAIFSVWHNISGSLLASAWGRKRDSLEYVIKDEQEFSTK